ncbi:MAG: SCP2 sterol-binding domain-containing protein [Actinobacteria bacterium]|nr:SCP2 sterol-binding domain-containing protein [Actinomycetota bacterium]
MSEATREFFESLSAREHEPLLHACSGTVRFDLKARDDVEHWFVRMTKGDVSVSRRRAKADCVVSVDARTFDGIVSGKTNAIAAALRGDVSIDGELPLILAFQRLFPGPPASGEHSSAGYARRPG